MYGHGVLRLGFYCRLFPKRMGDKLGKGWLEKCKRKRSKKCGAVETFTGNDDAAFHKIYLFEGSQG